MSGTHARNVGPMRQSLRCGAKTRMGSPCAAPAVSGKARCRMHGGAGSGAPLGNHNALKHGLYTAEERALKQHISQLIRDSREIIEQI
jgi:hypothetical protein